MAKETVSFEPALSPGAGHGTMREVEITSSIAACERVIDLKTSSGYQFRISAKAAHLLAVALYGLSEDHAEAVPPAPELRPGDLVNVVYLNGRGERVPFRGYYPDGTWRVSGTKEKAKDGYIFVSQGPRDRRLIQRDLVTFYSRPDKKAKA